MKVKVVIAAAVIISVFLSSVAGAVGPFEITARDSSASLRFQMAAQLQGYWHGKDSGASRDNGLFARARRIRPAVSITIPEYRTVFKLHLSMAPGAVELMDMYFNTEISPRVSIRAGQFKIPFSRYRIQSFQRLTFVDWSLVTTYFGAERQIGLALHNGFEKPPRLAYAVGVFNGNNARSSHATGLAGIFGEPVTNQSDLSGGAQREKFHPEFVGHVAYNGNGIAVASDSDVEGGELRYSLAASVAWDIDPTAYRDPALRLAQELLVKFRHISGMAAGYIGFTDIGGSLRTRQAFTGLLLQTACRLNRRFEVSLRYAHVEIDAETVDEAYDRAQAIMAASDDSDILSQYKNAGMVNGESEGSAGLTIYLDGHNFKIQSDGGFIRRDRRDDCRTDILIRSQLQLAF